METYELTFVELSLCRWVTRKTWIYALEGVGGSDLEWRKYGLGCASFYRVLRFVSFLVVFFVIIVFLLLLLFFSLFFFSC